MSIRLDWSLKSSYIFTRFLPVLSVTESTAEVFTYNFGFLCFSFQFYQILFHVSSIVTAPLGAYVFRIVKPC